MKTKTTKHKYKHETITELLKELCQEAEECPAKKHDGFNTALSLLKQDLNSYGKLNDKDLIANPADYLINEKDFCEIFSTLQKFYKFKEIPGEDYQTFYLVYDRIYFTIKHAQNTVFACQKLS